MDHSNISNITTIAEVDALIARSEDDALSDLAIRLSPFERRFWHDSPGHRRLLRLKEMFRCHPAVDKRFRERRGIHIEASLSNASPAVHVYAFERAFSAVNDAVSGHFGGGKVTRFLDMGCAPGGFSSWLMKNNPGAQGVGVTLPDEEATFPIRIDSALSSTRGYHLQRLNIITSVMKSVELGTIPVMDMHVGHRGELYDLVIAGAFPTMQGHIPWWSRVQLSLSQLLVALNATAPGGSCVLPINTKPFQWIVDVIGMFRQLFNTVIAYKDVKFHAVRTTCYLVCTGFHGTAEEIAYFSGKLRDALTFLDTVAKEAQAADSRRGAVDMTEEADVDEDNYGAHRASPEDLSLFSGESAAQIYDEHYRFVLDIFEPLWDIQYDAIRREFEDILRSGDQYGAQGKIRGGNRRSFGSEYVKSTVDVAQTGSPSSVWRPKRRRAATMDDAVTDHLQGIEDNRFSRIGGQFRPKIYGTTFGHSSQADTSSSWRSK